MLNEYADGDKFVSSIEPVIRSKVFDETTPSAIYSIEEAILRIKMYPHLRRSIVYDVLKNEAHGSAESFHLLIGFCRCVGDILAAYSVCEYAINRIKNSFILFADIIEISTDLEDPEYYCGIYIKKVESSNHKYWNLKLFTALFNYYYKRIDGDLLEKGLQIEAFTKARTLASEMQTVFYGKEDGYSAEARLLLLVGKRDEARTTLEEWIFYPLDPEKDVNRDLQCPKCCQLWIENFREYSGDWRRIEHVISKGLFDSEEDKDVNYFLNWKKRLDFRQRIQNSILFQDNNIYGLDALLKKK